MRDTRQLIVEARRAERAGRLEGAIRAYEEAVEREERAGGGVDLSLYNRLGDLHLRRGDPGAAVRCYETAADRYEDQQLYANAIALCKKILRNAPGRTEAHRRAGRLLTLAGLNAEARAHYVEYANHRQAEGEPQGALAALREFAELSGDEQIRLTLADRYLVAGDAERALGELRAVWKTRTERGEPAEEIRERILETDPEADPLSGDRVAGPEASAAGDGTPPAGVESSAAGVGPPAAGVGPPAGEPGAEARDEVRSLAAELEDVLRRLTGEERMRRALPIVDQLLRLEPGHPRLLLRKLEYALALEEPEALVEAYLAFGELLERRVPAFSLRLVSSSADSGTVTSVVDPGSRPAAGGRD